nr:neuropeptide S receptor [Pan troglodytes]
MPANFTEGSFDSSGTGQTLDSSPVACTETVTFTEVVEGKEWGSFYYSFKTEQLITLWVLFVFTIVGNSVVLFSTWRRKKKSRMTFFVTQLAITDKNAACIVHIFANLFDACFHSAVISLMMPPLENSTLHTRENENEKDKGQLRIAVKIVLTLQIP